MDGNNFDNNVCNQDLNPHKELDEVWEYYCSRSNKWVTNQIEEGFRLPPEATRKRMEMLKTLMVYRTTGVLQEPTLQAQSYYGYALHRPEYNCTKPKNSQGKR